MTDSVHFSTTHLDIDPFLLFAGFGGFIILALGLLLVIALRQGAERSREKDLRATQAQSAEAELAELKGRIAQMTEITAARQSELARSVNERLDRMSHLLGNSVEETGRRTSENLAKLHERLAVIDNAQKNITELSGRVVSLQDILANKQARGAFGQIRMEAIIEDGLPKGSYSFQPTLSNGKRPDCIVHLPNARAGIAIDAKFPLEGFEALRTAESETARKEAHKRIRLDVSKHIEDIAAKYLIAGETQDTAMLFVPAESVYAEIYETFPDLIQKAHRARVVIVSPNMLMLAVQTMMAIMKDVRMREQAGVIQRGVSLLMDDVHRLRDRVLDFQRHYGQLGPDLEKILISSDKITNRGHRIENLAFEDDTTQVTSAVIAAAE